MIQLQSAKHVRYRSDDHGGVVMLDTVSGEWLALNPSAGLLWRCWDVGGSFDEGVSVIAARYPATGHDAVRADAERLLRELVDRGLMTAAPPASPAAVTMADPGVNRDHQIRAGHLAVAYLCLVAASAVLRLPFRAPLALVRWSHRHPRRKPPDLGSAGRMVAAVSRASGYYPGRAACLEQSLAAVLLAALRRHQLTWCLGVATGPYRFHAWVEADGQPVLGPAQPTEPTYQRVLAV
jgi:hypothetical protein